MGDTVKRLAVLGSTGSIGQQTLDIVRALPNRFKVVGLAGNKNTDLLTRQIEEFKPTFVYSPGKIDLTRQAEYELMPMEDIATHPRVDMVIIAVSGEAGLSPTLAAVMAGKRVALANKESLVTAGDIITNEAELNGAEILPIDSEHSAIWQCLRGEPEKATRLILTASGGPFRGYSLEQQETITASQALKHPSWNMGQKVTIDSATLMNKGLEIIEAHWLFKMPYDNISVLIHPQSIIHSMVEFADGAVKAQLSCPDMRLPIQYALTYPERLPNQQLPKLDWDDIKDLTFETPDYEAFPCLKLAIEAGQQGNTYPAVLCAADEIAVGLFLSQRIKFTDIPRLIEWTLDKHQAIPHPTIEEIKAADVWARAEVLRLVTGDNK